MVSTVGPPPLQSRTIRTVRIMYRMPAFKTSLLWITRFEFGYPMLARLLGSHAWISEQCCSRFEHNSLLNESIDPSPDDYADRDLPITKLPLKFFTNRMASLDEKSREIEAELRPLLSANATISIPSTESFTQSNLRFTEYERPVKFQFSSLLMYSGGTITDD